MSLLTIDLGDAIAWCTIHQAVVEFGRCSPGSDRVVRVRVGDAEFFGDSILPAVTAAIKAGVGYGRSPVCRCFVCEKVRRAEASPPQDGLDPKALLAVGKRLAEG